MPRPRRTDRHGVCHGVTHGVTYAVSHGEVTPYVTVPPTRPDPTRPEKYLSPCPSHVQTTDAHASRACPRNPCRTLRANSPTPPPPRNHRPRARKQAAHAERGDRA